MLSSFLQTSAHALIVVLGPTASGKTAYSIKLAHRLQNDHGRTAEIVNADSRQLYRGMDIGTAKITREEMRGIPHHLLDVLDPNQEATAAWYKAEATRTIDAILARGNVPLLVGGSMLYISAIIDDLRFPTTSDPELRRSLEHDYDTDEGRTLHARLSEVDHESAVAIPRQNKHYLIRALEIFQSEGAPASAVRTKGTCPYNLLLLGITHPREELNVRINRRTKQMLQRGWIDEVLALLQRGFTAEDPGMKSHGYRSIIKTPHHDPELSDEISKQTRHYAKRQMTWWRGDERIQWLEHDYAN